MTNNEKLIRYVIIFLGGAALWLVGLFIGSGLISVFLTVKNPDIAVVIWGLIWALALCFATGFIVAQVYETPTS